MDNKNIILLLKGLNLVLVGGILFLVVFAYLDYKKDYILPVMFVYQLH